MNTAGAELPRNHRIARRRPFLAGIAEQPNPPLGARPGDARLAESLNERIARNAHHTPQPSVQDIAAHDAAVDALVAQLHPGRRRGSAA